MTTTLTLFDEAGAEEFRRTVREWLCGAVPAAWARDREALTPEQVHTALQEWDHALYDAGYAGLAWPAEYGGRGLGPVEEVIFYEEAARANAPEGFGRVGRILAGPTIIVAGSDEQKARYLPRILDGSEIWCQGFSEPGAGSDLAAVRTSAVRVDGGYRISGQKTWTSFAEEARRCLMLVRTSTGERPHHGLTFLLMDMEQPGVEVRPITQINGDREFSDVFVDDVFVPDEDRVGPEGQGWGVVIETKIWITDYGYDQALHAFDKSAGKLGVEQIDVLILHQPLPVDFGSTIGAYRALETLLADGRVRAIGISNFMPEHLDRLLAETSVVPAINQIEVHPYFRQPAVLAADAEHGILSQAWSPIGGITFYREGRLDNTLQDPLIGRIAKEHDRTPAQVMLRWHIQQGRQVIPKSVTPARIAENFAVLDFDLTTEELAAVDALDTGVRGGPDPATVTPDTIRREIPEA
jgi:2,5-diketo-D-gluconate reductase A